MRTATMKDVAIKAGVSIGTVDRVLHDRGRYSRETARRVHDAARRLRFQPNQIASNLSRARWYTVLALLPHPEQDGGFWQLVISGVSRAIRELAHHYLRVEFAFYDRFDPGSFERATGLVFSAGQAHDPGEIYTGVILAPTLQDSSVGLARLCANMPVVVLDGELPETDVLCSVSQDSLESGLLAGKLLHLVAGGGRFATVVLGKDDYHLMRRRAGFEAYCAEKADIATERLEADSESELRAVLRDRVQAEPVIDGIFVANAGAHIVIGALEPRQRPPVVGYDLVPENVARLRDGSLAFVINQQPENQGYQAVYALHRHLVLHEPVEPQIRIPVDVVTRETLRFHRSPQ